MGDTNQLRLVQKLIPECNGHILEVGSADHASPGNPLGKTASFRDFYTPESYTGIDLQSGPGVDEVVDLCSDHIPLPPNHYDLVVCCSVLEHTPTPWVMAQNIEKLTKPGGRIFISVPWVWRYHAYPDDYYRFSFSAIKYLFPGTTWTKAYYSTNVDGEVFEVDNDVDGRLAVGLKIKEGTPARKHMPYLMVSAVGIVN